MESGFNKAYPNEAGRKLRQAIRIARGEVVPRSATQAILEALKKGYATDRIAKLMEQRSALARVLCAPK